MSEPNESPQNRSPKNVPPQNVPPQSVPPAEPAMFGAHDAQSEPRNWTPLIVGFVLVLAVVAAIVFLGRSKPQVVTTADPYAPMLVVEKATLSQADNFVGATVTYIDLTVRNHGDRTVVGGSVQALFRDSLGEVVQTEALPLRVLLPHTLGGEDEAGDLAMAPLGPGQSRVLRITVEHISSQ